MTTLMEGEPIEERQMKFFTDPELAKKFESLLESQGLNIKTGFNRLMEFMLEIPEEMRPIVFRQAPGKAWEDIVEGLYNRRIAIPAADPEKPDDPRDTPPAAGPNAEPLPKAPGGAPEPEPKTLKPAASDAKKAPGIQAERKRKK